MNFQVMRLFSSKIKLNFDRTTIAEANLTETFLRYYWYILSVIGNECFAEVY